MCDKMRVKIKRQIWDNDLYEVEEAALRILRYRNKLYEAEEELRRVVESYRRQLMLPGVY